MVQDISDPSGLGQQPQQPQQMPQQQQPQQKPGVITFGSSKKQEPSPEIMQLTSQVAEVGRRIRTLEDRYSNIRRKTQVTDQNMLTIQKNISRELKTIDSQLLDLQKSISQIEDKMRQVIRELDNFAKSEDVRVMKRYMEFWRPLNFITRTEAEQLVRQAYEQNENRKV